MSTSTNRKLIVAIVGCAILGAGGFVVYIVVSTGRDWACKQELIDIDGAKQIWAERYHKNTNDIPTAADLQPIMYPGRPEQPFIPGCRKGGTYTIGRVGESPTCSYPGHKLHQ